MSVAVLGIDLAKHVFQLHGVDAHGRAIVSRRVSRAKLAEAVVQLAPRVVAMEAVYGAHYWGRRFLDRRIVRYLWRNGGGHDAECREPANLEDEGVERNALARQNTDPERRLEEALKVVLNRFRLNIHDL